MRPFTILVGPNGSGKSSTLRGLATVVELSTNQSYTRSALAEHRTSSGPSSSNVSIRTEGHPPLSATTDGGWRGPLTVAAAVYFRIDPDKVRQPSPKGSIQPFQAAGFGLASFLFELQAKDRRSMDRIVEDLRSIVPQVQDVRATSDPKNSNSSVFQIQFEGAGWIDAAQISDGTAVAVALITLLHSDAPFSVLLIDDIDRGLHPHAQREVVRVLRRTQERIPDLQIVATSHSPYLLDEFEPDEVVVFRIENGHSKCRVLSEHPDIEKWQQAMMAGEFWASVGEEWVH